jgi:uncharacterized protein YebE (UPF0316 family)
MIGVAMGTVRMIMIGRGQRIIAPLLGFVESIIWVVAISQVITNLDNIYNILGFSGGFAAGTLVGMLLENKLALGFVGINVVSMNHGSEIIEKLRQADYGVTELYGRGQSGAVIMITTIVSRKDIKAVIQLVNEVDPQSFIAVDDMAVVKRGYMHFAQ